ncbi:MAG TPA: hypothetical protein DCE56_41400 [Cyanobacteria bacterium UBA8553]|nr:hypothetical protein [Cyanobacteria bacterium UBA8553]HAJ64673.1 hypothetical protein [Cyanobacteria bacterium UBA8543]
MTRKKGAASILFVSLLMLGACSKNVVSKSESTLTPTNTDSGDRSNVVSPSESTPTPSSTEPKKGSSFEFRSDYSSSTTSPDSENRSDLEFPSDSSTSTNSDRFDNNLKGESMFVLNGVQIKIDPSIELGDNSPTHRSRSSTSITVNSQNFGKGSMSSSSSKIDVNGRQVEVVNGNLRIGGRSYGQVKSGDQVLISASGVQVNGKERSSQIF